MLERATLCKKDIERMAIYQEISVDVTDSTLDLEALFSVLEDVAGSAIESQDNLILIVPSDLAGRYDVDAFPGGTREVFRYLRERVEGQAMVEVAVRDSDYQEFEFLSADIILPALYVGQYVLLPMAINLLCDWLGRHIRPSGERDGNLRVRSEVHFNQNGTLKKITYEGPASTFEKVMSKSLVNQNPDTSRDENDHDSSVD